VSGAVVISSCGSDFDTVMQAYTGYCGSLTPILAGCDDDNGPACSGYKASMQFKGTAGTQYFIMAGGYGGASGNLNVLANAAPLQLSGAQMTSSGYQFVLTGPPGASCLIQYSTDLSTWNALGTYLVPPGGSVVVLDPSATSSAQRFYRAVLN